MKTKPATIDDALKYVPEYILFHSDNEVLEYSTNVKKGDEVFDKGEWVCADPEEWVSLKDIFRRKIPEDIRLSMAKRVLEMQDDKDNKIIPSHPFEYWLLPEVQL
jgi:hypothetical protein